VWTDWTGRAVRLAIGFAIEVERTRFGRPIADERTGALDPARIDAAKIGIEAPFIGAGPTFRKEFRMM